MGNWTTDDADGHGWVHFTLRAIRVIRVIRGQLFHESSSRSNSQRSAFLCAFAALRDENPRPARIGTRHFPSRGKTRRLAETAHALQRRGPRNSPHHRENAVEKSNGIRHATVTLPMITPNCRDRLTASDFDFIAGTLGAGRNNSATLAELLTDSEMRDAILDSENLFQAVLQGDAQLRISPQCYFYVLLRHVLKDRGIVNRETCDYLASLLETFSRTERMRAPGGAGEGPQQYVGDLLLALQNASSTQAFLLRAHIGNYTLFISGVFHDRVESRSRRGGPDIGFLENVGAANFHTAADHRVARQHALSPVFEELSERFRDVRLALNETADRHLHLDESPGILM